MAAALEYDATHDHHDHHDATGGGETASTGATVVSGFSALLYYSTYNWARWNAQTATGTQTVVTYSFVDTEDLPTLGEYDPYGANGYWSYNATQRAQFQDVIGKFEAAAGIRFVEVEGDAMINVMGANVSGVGGWANIAQSSETSTASGYFVNAYSGMAEGQYGYQVNLHELGHALGLKHPHSGDIVLAEEHDTQDNSVMTYNIENPYAIELGGFDVQALQEIYGTPDQFDGWDVSMDANDIVVIRATAASDIILAADVDSRVYGFDGNDDIRGREGDDEMHGNQGNDSLIGANGRDTLKGGRGDDLIYGDESDSTWAGDSTDHDRLYGNKGNDTIYGGDGSDKLYGGRHHDVLQGGVGRDKLSGGNGNDTIFGGDGPDRLIGDNGADVFVFDDSDAYETDTIVDFQAGQDKIDLSAFGYMTWDNLNIMQAGDHTSIEYSNWFDVVLNWTDMSELNAGDFLFI